MEIGQYDIVWINLDPTVGSEMQKSRPCVVISPPEMNKHLDTLIIAPMTTSTKKYPTRTPVLLKRKKGWIALDQIRTIDKKRVLQQVGHLTTQEIQAVKSIVQKMLVD